MPNETEWSSRWFGFIRHDSGGATYGEGYDGDRIGYSRFGEFACKLDDQGSMKATFPDIGVACDYDDEQRLVYVCIDVSYFLGNLDESDLAEMANGGANIRSISDDLEARGQVLFLELYPTIGRLVLEARDDEDLVSEDVIVNINLGEGFDGLIKYEGSQITYHIRRLGDEMYIAIGELDKNRRTLVPLSISNEVDYMAEMESESPKRYWKLADKIILNR